jgi:hypothetical protein
MESFLFPIRLLVILYSCLQLFPSSCILLT